MKMENRKSVQTDTERQVPLKVDPPGYAECNQSAKPSPPTSLVNSKQYHSYCPATTSRHISINQLLREHFCDSQSIINPKLKQNEQKNSDHRSEK